jgi:ACS family glucarate transporter-like MFS transporter
LSIGYFVASTGSFNAALWFVAAHGLLGIFAYVVLAGRFERIVIEQPALSLSPSAAPDHV